MTDRDEFGQKVRNRTDFDRRMRAARRRAQYEIGDPSWASVIVGAFLEPDNSDQAIAEEEAL